MSDTTDKATEIVAETIEDQAAAVASVVRNLTTVKLQFSALGAVCGAAAGAFAAYYLTDRRLRLKYNELAEDEIAEMREHYRGKIIALDATANKGALEDIVAEQGYAITNESDEKPPMAVTPPTQIIEAAEEIKTSPTAPVEVRNIFEQANEDADGWDYQRELAKRTPLRPYVIHIDERNEAGAYTETTFTYYDGDDVLCNERDEIVDNRDELIGEQNLEKFGHGSGDPSIVYVRNNKLQVDFEIVRSPGSFSEEVHGLTHGYSSGHLERMRERESRHFDDE